MTCTTDLLICTVSVSAIDRTSKLPIAESTGGTLTMYFILPAVNKVLEMFKWNQKDILTPREAVKLLRVTEEEFFNDVRSGHIPGNRINRQWRFSRRELLKFCERRFTGTSLRNSKQEKEHFFADKQGYEARAKQVIQAYKEGERDFSYFSSIEDGDFSNLDLSGINFWDGSLKRANFSGCILKDTVFVACVLEEANFEGADLTGADFREAFVLNANFKRVNLTKADFSVQIIEGADLSGAKIHQTRF
jgi:uncharacterized protein YjbI with pentapeptide repeats